MIQAAQGMIGSGLRNIHNEHCRTGNSLRGTMSETTNPAHWPKGTSGNPAAQVRAAAILSATAPQDCDAVDIWQGDRQIASLRRPSP
jgi:hypothetical protein